MKLRLEISSKVFFVYLCVYKIPTNVVGERKKVHGSFGTDISLYVGLERKRTYRIFYKNLKQAICRS